jgi:hypothetical protein
MLKSHGSAATSALDLPETLDPISFQGGLSAISMSSQGSELLYCTGHVLTWGTCNDEISPPFGGALASPLVARAQQPAKMKRIVLASPIDPAREPGRELSSVLSCFF